MSTLHICPLGAVERLVREVQPSHLVSLINAEMMIGTPATIAPPAHLKLGMNDIAWPREGLCAPGQAQIERLIGFIEDWPRRAPLLIHCWAGISRSTAAAYIALCVLNPDRSENELARVLRRAAPSASPNPLLIAHADQVLGRDNRMVGSIAAIGRGQEAFEGTPFSLPARISAP
jgi:predicted protein tyrosine phosphatase